ncbi:hypothetical protein SPSIL_015050 [Sporomusa silvacetica DSM 10669]|uniref:Uncharacterized protein n=1 Tax=Sporomusa silvacetica DSM 10669 TaxID=1123289 RepID=A0ABZ3II87_9FIRM|nr:hypothetical protein SPSIL_09780 [Sporomusa silvacetica DSM 10669]
MFFEGFVTALVCVGILGVVGWGCYTEGFERGIKQGATQAQCVMQSQPQRPC